MLPARSIEFSLVTAQARSATITPALQLVSRSVPIMFVNVTDPVGAGLVVDAVIE
jgi:hypothetical protein